MADQFEVPFFFWVSGIAQPSDMFPYDNGLFPENDGEHDRFLILYSTNVGMGEHAAGLIYDQVHHRATMALGIEDLGFTLPVEDHEDLWHPLEAVLSNWIEMVRIGKITASQDDAANEKYGPWTWQPYAARQVDSTIAAFARLVAAIEDRVPGGSLLPARDGPLLTDADLDAASVPKTCFARSLLTALPVPRFTAIAPGLLVPRDPEAFAVSQRFTTMNASSDAGVVIPPVLLFAAADGRTTDFDSPNPYESRNPFVQVYRDGVAHGDHSIPAGLYSESVDRSETDYAEEGFRLVLPFALGMRGVVDGRQGARKSDGQSVSEGSVAELFQHGFKPFGGEWWRAQRLERLLDRWRELVETGVWTVGEKGVEGTIELFAEADSDRWMHYWIPPDW
ncbi:Major facilitator superfamily domain, general substrate transporter [Pleurostoma richardsiae]|uniref:Major facilitator superfamily domain, general substrate transporter n=1 Tax=Pleurostoma richardsiae TaxID=41990 RepID=A0AA38VUZ4_9PEZI|nr:Major facilitator superfamily domain, general substrate transporter [Pleurostoma richardsiae]